MPTFWTAPRLWPSSTVFCIASGPSLRPDDVELCRGQHTIIVNNVYTLAPWADVLYAADRLWWEHHQAAQSFRGFKVSALLPPYNERLMIPGVHYLRLTGRRGFDADPNYLREGGLSGYQAVHLAAHFGASRIVLLGYDMKPDPSGKLHFFGNHPKTVAFPINFSLRLRDFATIAQPLLDQGIEVVNCTRDTALTCFPLGRLEEEVCWIPRPATP